MRSESLDLHSFSMGPFPRKMEAFNFEISFLHGKVAKKVFEYKEWLAAVNMRYPHPDDQENKQKELISFREWHEITNEKNETEWYLELKFARMSQRVLADFKFEMIDDYGHSVFYMWLNVSAV